MIEDAGPGTRYLGASLATNGRAEQAYVAHGLEAVHGSVRDGDGLDGVAGTEHHVVQLGGGVWAGAREQGLEIGFKRLRL